MKQAPTLALWKMLEKPPYATGGEYLAALTERGYRVSDWIIDIVSRTNTVTQTGWPLPLVRVSLASLGFTGPTHLSDFYDAAVGEHGAGFENPSPEVALAVRFLYDEQPTGEWLRIGTKLDAMIDSDGVPHLPKLGKALGRYYIESYWSYPKAVFHPHNEFVLIDRRLR